MPFLDPAKARAAKAAWARRHRNAPVEPPSGEPVQENPFTAARLKLGLSRTQAALLGGIGYGVLAAHEAGQPALAQPAVLAAFQTLGFEPEVLARQYRAWRLWRAGELMAALHGVKHD
jgi:hypothetical protein